MDKSYGICHNCEHESDYFTLKLGSDLHSDGQPIEEDCPNSEWWECPKCNFLSWFL